MIITVVIELFCFFIEWKEINMENKYIRTKFEGLTEEVYKWEQLNWSSFCKEEIRKK